MYTLDEVKGSLDADAIDRALSKLEMWARANAHPTLASWANAELIGHKAPDTPEALGLEYRRISVELKHYGRRVAAALHWCAQGIDALLPYAEEGCRFSDMQHALAEGYAATLPSGALKSLFAGARAEAKRRLLSAVGNAGINASSRPMPNFSRIFPEPSLIAILEQRWREAEAAHNVGAFLAVVILLGSILEGALLGKAEANLPTAMRAQAVPPDTKTGKPLVVRRWTLSTLIDVAHEVGWLKKDAKDFSTSLREYRNLVHPNEQRATGFSPSSGTCDVSWAVVGAALMDLTA